MYRIIIFSVFLSLFANLATTVFASGSDSDEVIVSIDNGQLRGSKYLSRKDRQYFAFLGVRYGEAKARFEVSLPASKWNGIKDATKYGEECPQLPVFGPPDSEVLGSEDCLFLNVFSPKISPSAKLPVMVFFHSGAFRIGSGQHYPAKYFMDENIILVTVNYRLGVLGFLSTGDSVLQGNLGLKDQVLSLQWVRDNIKHFGGDSGKVTIFGQSAGGASVSYHLLSPLSDGLFHRAISQSGSALNPWAFIRTPLENTKALGKLLNCPTQSTNRELVFECIKKKSIRDILSAQRSFVEITLLPFTTFGPVVEKRDASNKDPIFLPDTPYALMSTGKFKKVPYIVGFTEHEGLLLSAGMFFNEDLRSQVNNDYNRLSPLIFDYSSSVLEKNLDEVEERIRKFYLKNEDINQETWGRLTEALSERLFNHGIYKTANLLAKYTQVYPYVFTFVGDFSYLEVFYGFPDHHGIEHFNDIQYLFNGSYGAPEHKSGTEMGKFSEKLVSLWTSFAESGKPTATWGPVKQWKPINPQNIQNSWYKIDAETSLIEDDFNTNYKFWESLPLTEMEKENPDLGKDEL